MNHMEYLDIFLESKSYKIVEVNADHPHSNSMSSRYVGGTLTQDDKNYVAVGAKGTSPTEGGAHGIFKAAYHKLDSAGWLSDDKGKVLRVQL